MNETGRDYADWLTGRLGALVPSIERFLALMADPRSADPAWRERVRAEFAVWANQREAPTPPPELRRVDRKLRAITDALDAAAAMFDKAIEADDPDLATRAFALLLETERSTRELAAETVRAWPRMGP